eukprot:scaffold803_cov310-Pinguiococcus_pyrenoidosus.AAC.219
MLRCDAFHFEIPAHHPKFSVTPAVPQPDTRLTLKTIPSPDTAPAALRTRLSRSAGRCRCAGAAFRRRSPFQSCGAASGARWARRSDGECGLEPLRNQLLSGHWLLAARGVADALGVAAREGRLRARVGRHGRSLRDRAGAHGAHAAVRPDP